MKHKFTNTPILVANTEWDLPEKLIEWVEAERMVTSLINMMQPSALTPEEQVGSAEVTSYLLSAAQQMPFCYSGGRIYLYCASRLLINHKYECPKELIVDELTVDETEALNQLKRWIFEHRGGKYKHPVLEAFNEVFKESKNDT